jgi:alpha-tubulin suppressor-like RCC1 family protein
VLIATALVLTLAVGCKDAGSFPCQVDTECELGGVLGVCEPSGFCSFEDLACVSGRRYDESAGEGLGDECVEPLCVMRISAGIAHTCAIRDNRRVWCWGDGQEGELGTGDTESSNVPVESQMADAVEVVAGFRFSCARGADWVVSCWGYGEGGSLGNGSRESATAPQPITLPAPLIMVQIDAGRSHVCARDAVGVLLCWGPNEFGQLGADPSGMDSSDVPVEVGGLAGTIDVATGNEHTCAVKEDGSVWCWGSNGNGRLGVGDTELISTHEPMQVVGITDALEVVTGGAHACARLRDGAVWCWGSDRFGQLGLGLGPNDHYEPSQSGIANVAQLASGENHTCALHEDGTVKCWGANGSGQLGDGKLSGSTSPSPVQVSGIDDALAIDGGEDHTCVIRESGQVWCWGRNGSGRLGDDTQDARDTPVQALIDCG